MMSETRPTFGRRDADGVERRATAPADRAARHAAAPGSARGRPGFRRTNSGRPDRRSRPSGPTVASPGGAALGLERQRDDGVARHLVVGDGVAEPGVEAPVGLAQPRELGRIVVEPLIVRIAEARRDVGDHGRIERQRTVLDRLPLGLDLAGEGFGAEVVHQDLDARLVDVVAPAELIVDAQDRLDIAQRCRAWAGTA